MKSKRVFISADHGLAIVYFLQSDVVPTLLDADVEVILLTDGDIKAHIEKRFGRSGLTIESLRLDKASQYAENHHLEIQWWLNFLRRVGSSNRINTEAMDSYIHQVAAEESRRRLILYPAARAMIALLRRSKTARKMLVDAQMRYNPHIYKDLFEKYKPDLVIASTPGWRMDRYLLREAASRGIQTAAVVVGWDNPSSYSIPGAKVDWITCWSELQKNELVLGSDWHPDQVNIGGIPSYDGYFNKIWLMPRQDYFYMHGLDPQRKLLSYAASFVSFSPNYQNIEALVHLVSENKLVAPSQLLIRLHPNHFLDHPLYSQERIQIQDLAQQHPHIHVVEPVPLGGSLGYYSGEDMPEKTSMMAHSDVFITVYSTMVVESAIHDRPIVSACIDATKGWNRPRKYSLPLSQIGDWPTHKRFREAGAGRVAFDEETLRSLINVYLQNADIDFENRQHFIKQECTFTDGSAGRRTAEYLLSLLGVSPPIQQRDLIMESL